jgi:hypothetical protein
MPLPPAIYSPPRPSPAGTGRSMSPSFDLRRSLPDVPASSAALMPSPLPSPQDSPVPNDTHKSERAISLARSRPLYSDFSEIWFGFQITTLVTLESFGTHKLTPAFTSLFYDHPRCKNFPTAAGLQLPEPSLVADSRRRLLVRSLLWKIALPLKAILRASNGNASASGKFLLWK